MSDDTTHLFITRTSKEAQDVLWLLSVTNFPKLNHKIHFQRYSLGSFYTHHKIIIFFLSQMKNAYLVFLNLYSMSFIMLIVQFKWQLGEHPSQIVREMYYTQNCKYGNISLLYVDVLEE